MLYDNKIQEAVLDVLDNRISGIADCIIALLKEGYIPNKNKSTTIRWGGILVDAYQNIDILTKEQQRKLDNIYNKIILL